LKIIFFFFTFDSPPDKFGFLKNGATLGAI